MSDNDSIVFMIDDDDDVRKALRWLFESVNLPVEDYPSVKAFLAGYRSGQPGCLVLDVRMPDIDGLEFLSQMNTHRIWLPVIIITGHGDVPMAVKAMQLGAIDFVQKPVNHQKLLDRVRSALSQDRDLRKEFGDPVKVEDRLALLTPKEQEVMRRLVEGQSNKEIAYDLGIGARTVETHRANIMQKLQATSLAQLVRMALLARFHP